MNENQVDLTSFRAIDSLPVRNTALGMIDMTKVESHIARAVERGRYHGPTNPVEYLKQKRCVIAEGETTLATPAGILCFGHQPQEVFPRAVVDLVHYRGIDAVSFEVAHLEKDIGETIFDQITRIEAYLWTNTHHGMTIDNTSAQRIELHEYPRVVSAS